MSASSPGNPPPAAHDPEVDQSRRNLLVATCVAGGAAAAAGAWPFLASMEPSERARALGAPVEADISGLEPGTMMIVEWRGQPVWLLRRTPEMMATLSKDTAQLADPQSKRSIQPEYCENEWRAREEKKDVLVAVGICTHLGCSPVARFAAGDPGMGSSWLGGFLCPCHGSRFDFSARVFANFPAPDNLTIPRYKYLSDSRVLIGEDKA